jgi:hypothetical protein
MNNIEIHLNLKTREVRRKTIPSEAALTYHSGFTKADEAAGWKQVAALNETATECVIETAIAKCKRAYLKENAAQ